MEKVAGLERGYRGEESHGEEEMMDEIVRELVEVFDLPPARARAIVEMVAARLQPGPSRGGHEPEDDDHDEGHRSDEHAAHHRDHEGGHGSGKSAKKGRLRGLLGDASGFLGGE
jgi:hypothetical protein